MLFIKIVTLSLLISVINCYWQPTPLTNWTWQLSGTIDTGNTKNVLVYDIDLWDTSSQTIQSLKQSGKKVIYYFSAGSYEDWRQDQNLFPACVKGNPLDGWLVV